MVMTKIKMLAMVVMVSAMVLMVLAMMIMLLAVGGVHLGVSWVLGSWLLLAGCLTGGGTWRKSKFASKLSD